MGSIGQGRFGTLLPRGLTSFDLGRTGLTSIQGRGRPDYIPWQEIAAVACICIRVHKTGIQPSTTVYTRSLASGRRSHSQRRKGPRPNSRNKLIVYMAKRFIRPGSVNSLAVCRTSCGSLSAVVKGRSISVTVNLSTGTHLVSTSIGSLNLDLLLFTREMNEFGWIGLDFDLLRHKLHMDMKRLVGNPLLVLVTSRKGSFFGLRKSLIHRARCGSAPACDKTEDLSVGCSFSSALALFVSQIAARTGDQATQPGSEAFLYIYSSAGYDTRERLDLGTEGVY
ncbi:hypothetical protein CISIN_1g040094mg [Citrus sinensis]|uniref:Uncharacterized protein n=1 Tax=Citrus sinensis TaxID=2711 RepID=A0A067DE24_CITSI|nr:hypothetical protein CISIN_1g040094mg [Citrus sinensis]